MTGPLAVDWDPRPYARQVLISRPKLTPETLALAGSLTAAALDDPMFPIFIRRKVLAETGVDPRDPLAVANAIHDFTERNVGFQPDPLVVDRPEPEESSVYDYVQTPHWTLFLEGFGDCLAHSNAQGSVALALGHGFGYRTFKADPTDPERFSHVYALLGFKGPRGEDVWIPSDSTVPGFNAGDQPPEVQDYDPHDFIVARAA